jgi:glucose-fructose oxidoreductase
MPWRFAAADFDQMHLNTNVEWVLDHPDASLVGICDENPATSTGSMVDVVAKHGVPDDRVFDDIDSCIEATEPDVVLGAPNNAAHADFVERVAAHDVHLAIEKPFARSIEQADRMLRAVDDDQLFVVNWPSTWDPVMHTVKRLVEEGVVGDVIEVQYYGGNAGAPPEDSWFYSADHGGGSLLDYLGYGATFSTWFRDGELPRSVGTRTHVPEDMEVDVQSASVCEYDDGLSTLQTSWRMFTHPWDHETAPPKGYEISGTGGTITTRQHDAPIVVQTAENPEGRAVEPDDLDDRFQNLVHYLVDCLETGRDPSGPSDPAFCRHAQRLIETAQRSAADGGVPVELVE